MLDTKQLKADTQCYYKGKVLTFQSQKSVSGKDFFVFSDESGREKKLSKNETEKQVWIEVHHD